MLCMAFGLVLVAARAGYAADAGGDDAVPLYCLDSAGKAQLVKYFNSATMGAAFSDKFGLVGKVVNDGAGRGRMIFSEDGTATAANRITYDISSYQDGLLLRRMHVRLKGIHDDLAGNAMCFKTMSLVLGK